MGGFRPCLMLQRGAGGEPPLRSARRQASYPDCGRIADATRSSESRRGTRLHRIRVGNREGESAYRRIGTRPPLLWLSGHAVDSGYIPARRQCIVRRGSQQGNPVRARGSNRAVARAAGRAPRLYDSLSDSPYDTV